MGCKGYCSRYKANKPYHNNRYLVGQKRCQICTLFVQWEGIFCPCCGYKLRLKPRKPKNKETLRIKLQILSKTP